MTNITQRVPQKILMEGDGSPAGELMEPAGYVWQITPTAVYVRRPSGDVNAPLIGDLLIYARRMPSGQWHIKPFVSGLREQGSALVASRTLAVDRMKIFLANWNAQRVAMQGQPAERALRLQQNNAPATQSPVQLVTRKP